jgi:hypothetical protein
MSIAERRRKSRPKSPKAPACREFAPWCLPLFLCAAVWLACLFASGDSYVPPLYATWVNETDNVEADPYHGWPTARCDHIFRTAAGHSTRDPDPMKGILWMAFGQSRNSSVLSDSWLLNLTGTTPYWSYLPYSNSTYPLSGRWGAAASFLPAAIANGSTVALVFAGTSVEPISTLDDIFTIDLQTGEVTFLQPPSSMDLGGNGEERGSDTQPTR